MALLSLIVTKIRSFIYTDKCSIIDCVEDIIRIFEDKKAKKKIVTQIVRRKNIVWKNQT